MKVEIKGWIYRYQSEWTPEQVFHFMETAETEKPRGSEDSVYLFPHSFEVEVPEGAMIQERVYAIRAAKIVARQDLNVTLTRLDEAEQKLLCLTNEVEAADDCFF